jgi:hypothetical protein
VAKRNSESLARTERLMEEVCELEHRKQALRAESIAFRTLRANGEFLDRSEGGCG